jgi:hypothetical protein
MDCNTKPEIDNLLTHFGKEILKKYWALEMKLVWNFEQLIDFPFRREITPEFLMETNWKLENLKNYLFTWSAVQNYIQINNSNPIDLIAEQLNSLWGDEKEKKKIVWNLKINVGGLLNR